MMKKWIVFLAVLMLLAAMAVPAFAADTEVAVAVSGDVAYAGDEITVTVSVSGDVPYTSIGYVPSYDKDVFEFVSFASADNTGALTNKYDETTGVCMALFDTATDYAGELFILKLKVKADAPFKTVTIGGEVNANNLSDAVAVTVKSAQVTIKCLHNYAWEKVDDEKHAGTCSICGEVAEENHDWADEPVEADPATCTDPGYEIYECLLCKATKRVDVDAKGHAWDNGCDPDCNNGCGEIRDVSHKYADQWSADEKNHWHECTVCGGKDKERAHKPGAAATEKDPQVCTECDYVIEEAKKHVHDFDTSIWQQDAENHWHVCKKAGCYTWGATAKHEYDDECDVNCNVCGHVRIAPHFYGTEWQGNAYGHWMVCVRCGEQSTIMPHIAGDPATADTPQVCTECQYWIKYPLSHEHSYEMIWESDEFHHWQCCKECGEMSTLLSHSWDAGTVLEEPTETKEGSKSYTCLDCGYIRIAIIPATGTQQTDPSTQPGTSTDPSDPSQQTDPEGTRPTITPPSEQEEFPWWILTVAAATLLITGIVLFIIEYVRGRKHNMRGKFSK